MCVRSLAQCVPCVFWIIYIICTLYAAWRRQPGVIAPPTPLPPRSPSSFSRGCHNICKWHCVALPMHRCLLCFCIYCISHLTTKILTLDMFTRWTWQSQLEEGERGAERGVNLFFFLFPFPNTIRESVEKTCTHPVRRVTPTRRKKQFICKSSESLSHPPPATPPTRAAATLAKGKKIGKEKPKFVCSKCSNLQLPLRPPPTSSSSSAAVASVVQRCYDS